MRGKWSLQGRVQKERLTMERTHNNSDCNIKIVTNSPEETFNFGHMIGSVLGKGDVVALIGELGSGKTWLSKGIAAGLNVPNHEYVNSPAFDLIHEYQGDLNVYHIDFYRIDSLSPEDYAWLEEYLYGDGVCIIEWAEKFMGELLESYLKVELYYVQNRIDQRELKVSAVGQKYRRLINQLAV